MLSSVSLVCLLKGNHKFFNSSHALKLHLLVILCMSMLNSEHWSRSWKFYMSFPNIFFFDFERKYILLRNMYPDNTDDDCLVDCFIIQIRKDLFQRILSNINTKNWKNQLYDWILKKEMMVSDKSTWNSYVFNCKRHPVYCFNWINIRTTTKKKSCKKLFFRIVDDDCNSLRQTGNICHLILDFYYSD